LTAIHEKTLWHYSETYKPKPRLPNAASGRTAENEELFEWRTRVALAFSRRTDRGEDRWPTGQPTPRL